ncbi:Alpha/Beta hydrolase protein [Catenaria anguillulae PL171]|uniref:Alpha/Beta hydrolase protein n=1 Tax=Catenaria anguillulae PL171 TaxID=765915 RepID=A0A1Y2HVP3_9FUNG|nr:Alpha/Beta hydrolase protein [Catenaria anguillulae PL171]
MASSDQQANAQAQQQVSWFRWTGTTSDFKSWPLPAKVASIAIATPLVVYLYKCASLILFQHELVYLRRLPPGSRNQPFPSPQPHGLIASDIVLPSEANGHGRDPQLHGLLVRRLQDAYQPSTHPETTILYLQGNGGNIAHRHAKFRSLLDTLSLAGVPAPQVLAVGYRGYGHSRGRPSEHGLIRDAQRFLDYAIHHLPCESNRVIAYGHSLGGAVALSLVAASTSPSTKASPIVKLVVLENTFTSIKDMLQHWYPRSSPFHHLHPFLRSRWDSLAAIDALPCGTAEEAQDSSLKVALIAGEADDMVPHAQMKQLRDKLTSQLGAQKVKWYPVAGGMHNTTWESQGWRNAWREIGREWMMKHDMKKM